MPKIYVLSGPDTGRRFDVGDGAAIGRAVECAVQLHDASVSRQHARVENADGGWRIVDAGSRNGVRVSGERVPLAPLRDGDEFQVGEVLLRFRADVPEPTSDVGELAPAPRTAADVTARPAASVSEVDEITLEEDPLESAPLPVAETRTFAPPLAGARVPDATGLARAPESAQPGRAAPARPGEPVQRGQRVLQYQRVEARDGFFASDLGQHSVWVRIGALLLALLVFTAIFLVAFRGTSFLKSRASGGVGAPASEAAAGENG